MEQSKGNAVVRVLGEWKFGDVVVTALDVGGVVIVPVDQVGAGLGYTPKRLTLTVRRWERAGLVRPEHLLVVDGRAFRTGSQSGDRSLTHLDRKLCLTEAGLYRVLMLSKMPKALEFQDWLERDLLPTIRRTGEYRRDGPSFDDVTERKALPPPAPPQVPARRGRIEDEPGIRMRLRIHKAIVDAPLAVVVDIYERMFGV